MKTMLSSKRDRHLARFSIFLIAIALIAGMVGCTDEVCALTIRSTDGGQVTTPGEGTRSYVKGTKVDLVATPDAGYRFDGWTGPVDRIGDVNAAVTTIVMNRRSTIEARFVKGREIRNWNDLDAIRNDSGGSHILMNNLDSTTAGYENLASPTANGGKGWQPIGTFTDTFDGRDYEIRDLFIKRPDENGVGLFGYVGRGGKIQNIRAVNATVTGQDSVGGLVGENYGTVSDSYSTSSVTGEKSTGGLVGYNKGTVSNSHFTGNVTGRDEYVGGLVGWNYGSVSSSSSSSNVIGNNNYVGGLVGFNYEKSTVTHCHSSSNVTGSDEHVGVGGLVGYNRGTVKSSHSTGNVKGNVNVGGLVGFNYLKSTVWDCHSSGNVTSEEGSHIGGLVGWNEGSVRNSYSSSSVSGRLYVGGLVGGNEINGTVSESYSTGNVTGDTHVGGLVGHNDRTVEKSYSTGSVIGNSRVGGLVGYNRGAVVRNSYSSSSVSGRLYVGGLVGYNEQSSVENCYSTGKVTGFSQLGGLVGRNDAAAINSFWDTETSGQSTSAGGTGKTTAEMKSIATFSAWQITSVAPGQTSRSYIWNIVNGVTYPFLSWEPVS